MKYDVSNLKQLLRKPLVMTLFAAWAITAIANNGYEFGRWLHDVVG
jgi:hypothetical protein